MTRRGGPPEGSIVLPAYNAGAQLEAALGKIARWASRRGERWEVVVADDGSTDDTPNRLRRWRAMHPDVPMTVVRLERNRGKGFAVRAGLQAARGRWLIFTDVDLAYPPRNFDAVLARLKEGVDAVIASRVAEGSVYRIRPAFFRYLYTRHVLGRAFNLLCRAILLPGIRDTQAGLKGFRSESVRPLLARLVLDGFSFDVELLRALRDNRMRVVECPVDFRYDSEPSTVRFLRDSLCMIRDLLRVSIRSIRGRYALRDRARVHVHADDFGLAPEINRAVMEDLSDGIVHGASLLTTGDAAREALAWAAAHPEYPFGVHLNVTEGRPILPAEAVPSLVDERGSFHSLASFLWRWARRCIQRDELRREWTAQIEAALQAGVRITRLDSHQHVHHLPGLMRDVLVPLARRYRCGIRLAEGPAGSAFGVPDGKAVGLKLLASAARRHASDGRISWIRASRLLTGRLARPEALRRILEQAAPETELELVVHPALESTMDPSRATLLRAHAAERRLLRSLDARLLLGRAEMLPASQPDSVAWTKPGKAACKAAVPGAS